VQIGKHRERVRCGDKRGLDFILPDDQTVVQGNADEHEQDGGGQQKFQKSVGLFFQNGKSPDVEDMNGEYYNVFFRKIQAFFVDTGKNSDAA